MASAATTTETLVFEKLGSFYLGRVFDTERDQVLSEPLLYDAKDLTTHAVCVGMTGSGKTGLCLSLLEEAAIDGIPALAIDPKGDLGNLLLTFPNLAPADFRPWIDEAEAARKGLSPDEYASSIASKWRAGLAEWGQDGARIERLRQSASLSIYTPGSGAGRPLSVLRSFAAPPSDVMQDADLLRERIGAAASGLLALMGIDADPVRSREHILLSSLLQAAWQRGLDLDLASLIANVQHPPFERVGVMDVETFYPQQERFELSMRLNALLASPGFAAWMEGEPLEIPRLLWTPDGRPRMAILSIAHLSDAERMFFVTVLLNEVVTWMRTQPGTGSLRALVYMDEVFGYFPPTANPPSKSPMLTLLKQGRAYGIGVMLATQNPVDLDYKGLSNAGTWFLGRLQTERDKLRVMEGLEGASTAAGATFDRRRMETTLAGLKSRIFLMNNVHEDEPVLFHTRWALSYLRGPLTRAQIKILAAGQDGPSDSMSSGTAAVAGPASARRRVAVQGGVERPLLPSEAGETFAAVTRSGSEGTRLLYRPALLGSADLHFVSAKDDVDEWRSVSLLAPLGKKGTAAPWKAAEQFYDGSLTVGAEPSEPAEFAAAPAAATNAKSYGTWAKSLKTQVYKDCGLVLRQCAELKLVSKPGETGAEFSIRVREAARERRDLAVEKLRSQYAPKLARLQERIRKAEARVERERDEYGHHKTQAAISMGTTVLGALLGRKVAGIGTMGRASSSMRSMSRAARQKEDIARAAEDLNALQSQLEALEAEFAADAEALNQPVDPAAFEIVERTVAPRKSDITVGTVSFVWLPWWVDADGVATPAFEFR